jgi:hypothetical protein
MASYTPTVVTLEPGETRHHALATCVLVVAIGGPADDWAAYVDAVPGRNHKQEAMGVANMGCKIRKDLAHLVFPQLDPDKYRD